MARQSKRTPELVVLNNDEILEIQQECFCDHILMQIVESKQSCLCPKTWPETILKGEPHTEYQPEISQAKQLLHAQARLASMEY